MYDSFSRHTMFLLLVMMGMLFYIGAEIHIGINDNDPITIPIPQNAVVGWLFIVLSFVYAIPASWSLRVYRFIKRRVKDSELVPNIKAKFGGMAHGKHGIGEQGNIDNRRHW